MSAEDNACQSMRLLRPSENSPGLLAPEEGRHLRLINSREPLTPTRETIIINDFDVSTADNFLRSVANKIIDLVSKNQNSDGLRVGEETYSLFSLIGSNYKLIKLIVESILNMINVDCSDFTEKNFLIFYYVIKNSFSNRDVSIHLARAIHNPNSKMMKAMDFKFDYLIIWNDSDESYDIQAVADKVNGKTQGVKDVYLVQSASPLDANMFETCNFKGSQNVAEVTFKDLFYSLRAGKNQRYDAAHALHFVRKFSARLMVGDDTPSMVYSAIICAAFGYYHNDETLSAKTAKQLLDDLKRKDEKIFYGTKALLSLAQGQQPHHLRKPDYNLHGMILSQFDDWSKKDGISFDRLDVIHPTPAFCLLQQVQQNDPTSWYFTGKLDKFSNKLVLNNEHQTLLTARRGRKKPFIAKGDKAYYITDILSSSTEEAVSPDLRLPTVVKVVRYGYGNEDITTQYAQYFYEPIEYEDDTDGAVDCRVLEYNLKRIDGNRTHPLEEKTYKMKQIESSGDLAEYVKVRRVAIVNNNVYYRCNIVPSLDFSETRFQAVEKGVVDSFTKVSVENEGTLNKSFINDKNGSYYATDDPNTNGYCFSGQYYAMLASVKPPAGYFINKKIENADSFPAAEMGSLIKFTNSWIEKNYFQPELIRLHNLAINYQTYLKRTADDKKNAAYRAAVFSKDNDDYDPYFIWMMYLGLFLHYWSPSNEDWHSGFVGSNINDLKGATVNLAEIQRTRCYTSMVQVLAWISGARQHNAAMYNDVEKVTLPYYPAMFDGKGNTWPTFVDSQGVTRYKLTPRSPTLLNLGAEIKVLDLVNMIYGKPATAGVDVNEDSCFGVLNNVKVVNEFGGTPSAVPMHLVYVQAFAGQTCMSHLSDMLVTTAYSYFAEKYKVRPSDASLQISIANKLKANLNMIPFDAYDTSIHEHWDSLPLAEQQKYCGNLNPKTFDAKNNAQFMSYYIQKWSNKLPSTFSADLYKKSNHVLTGGILALVNADAAAEFAFLNA